MRRATSQQPEGTTRTTYFYPRSPCGERLHRTVNIQRPTAFLSTLSLRRATANAVDQILPGHISIHALLAESDNFRSSIKRAICNFYPRSPCGERRQPSQVYQASEAFLSTLSLRRATPATRRHDKDNIFLSTLSLRRATLSPKTKHKSNRISIHALLAESDETQVPNPTRQNQFLSTLSLRRATCYSLRHSAQGRHFYPRSPCGERRDHANYHPLESGFLSTLSLRRATDAHLYKNLLEDISIHALLAESDQILE